MPKVIDTYTHKLNGHRDVRHFNNVALHVGSEWQWTAVQYVILTTKEP